MPDTSPPNRPRTKVYIDGFNLYYGVLRGNPEWKWLNIFAFCERLRPHEEVVAVNYFTARIDPGNPHSPIRQRQEKYLKALSTLTKVKIIEGKYQEREVTCRGRCREKYRVPEEKKTDVAIAVSMISDAIQGDVDQIVLISADSDQEPAVEWILKRNKGITRKVKICVYIPEDTSQGRRPRRNDAYAAMGADAKSLPLNEMKNCQFDNSVALGSGRTVDRPREWR